MRLSLATYVIKWLGVLTGLTAKLCYSSLATVYLCRPGLSGTHMLPGRTRDLVILLYCSFDDDAPRVPSKFFLTTMRIIPIHIRIATFGSNWGTNDALHLYLISSLFEVALCIVRWFRSIYTLSNERCEGRRTCDHDSCIFCQSCIEPRGWSSEHTY